MACEDISRETVMARLDGSDIFNAYESGRTDDQTFAKEMVQLFDLGVDVDGFPALWNSWVEPPYPGTMAVLADLKTRFTTACLSNTNALHWDHINSHIQSHTTFHHAFASHLINVAKPALESYLIPVERMGVPAEQVWFFDDTMENIEAAREAGLRATHVARSVGVIPTLREQGLI